LEVDILLKLKQLGVAIILLSLLSSMIIGCRPQFQPGTFTDDMGREINIDKIPQRIVSHVPNITEILFALGLEERVVGVSDYCNYPEEAELKSSVGNYFNPSIENIVALDPDLVLTDGHSENILPQLDSLGITYVVINPDDIDGILRNIELIGRFSATEKRAREIIEDIEDRILQVTTKVKDATQVRVFYMFDATDLNNPWTAGPGSFADSLITMAGGENIAAQAQGAWVQFSLEAVVASDPEIIILPAKHGTASISPEVLKEHPTWREITAVKQDRIYIIDGDLVDRPGPRIVQGLEKIAEIVHPELFR
jgi:iron complex transport system substrate-binding protein